MLACETSRADSSAADKLSCVVLLWGWQGLLGARLTRKDASEFFFATKGLLTHEQRAKARDREMDLHEFIECCDKIAAHLGMSLTDIATGREAMRSAMRSGQTAEGRTTWEKEFPLHCFAAKGDLVAFTKSWAKLKAIQVCLGPQATRPESLTPQPDILHPANHSPNAQAHTRTLTSNCEPRIPTPEPGIQTRLEHQAKGLVRRDLPFLAALLLKKRKASELRVFKSQKPPPPPLWAQSSSNLGIENAFDNGGWTCLHHAAARGHTGNM